MTRVKQPPKASSSSVRDEKLAAAVAAYRHADPKPSVRGLAKSFGVTLSTLQNRLNGAQSRSDEMESRRRLSPVETKVLASHAERMQALKFPLTPADVRLEGERLFHAKDPEAAAQGAKLGINWYREVFLKDNPDFVNKLGKGLDRDRATCASHAQLSAWFENVSDCGGRARNWFLMDALQILEYITEYGITWENFWNMDEKGYLIGEFSEHFLLPLSLTSTGIGTAQIFCVRRGTTEAKMMQGMAD